MAEVYYYVPAKETDHIIECGLKLSQWYDKEVLIERTSKRCISALLNPKDDIKKFNDDTLRCIKMELPFDYCYVADKYLFEVGQSKPEVMDLYYKSIIPLENYIFGLYRLPECLVTTTVIPGQIYVVNKAQDSPVLFNNSEELYLNNLIEINKETYDQYEDMSLYYFYSKLAEGGNITKIEDLDRGIAIFVDKGNTICNNYKTKVYTIKIPEMGSDNLKFADMKIETRIEKTLV